METPNNIYTTSQDAPITGDTPTKATSKLDLKKIGALVTKIGGIISGLLSFILGLCMFDMGTGRWTDYEFYGGDAYSGIQNAAADTAVNVLRLNEIVQSGFAFVLIAAGLIAIFAFGSMLFSKETH